MNKSIDKTKEALRVERALKLALEALEHMYSAAHDIAEPAITAIREALAAVPEAHKQPAQQQEPVAWADECRISLVTAIHFLASDYENALGVFRDDTEARRKAEGDIAHARNIAAKWNWNGASPPYEATPLASQRSVKPWRGLTDEELSKLVSCTKWRSDESMHTYAVRACRAIEAKLRENNA